MVSDYLSMLEWENVFVLQATFKICSYKCGSKWRTNEMRLFNIITYKYSNRFSSTLNHLQKAKKSVEFKMFANVPLGSPYPRSPECSLRMSFSPLPPMSPKQNPYTWFPITIIHLNVYSCFRNRKRVLQKYQPLGLLSSRRTARALHTVWNK